jgi:SAM-dependent methyltransferase
LYRKAAVRLLKYSLVPEHGLDVVETVAAGDIVGALHVSRYWTAWTIAAAVQAASAVDLGCGCGYGCRILVEHHPTLSAVTGIDLFTEGLNLARRDYGTIKALNFIQFDLDAIWPNSLPSDLQFVTAFEILEYIRHRDLFLTQLVQHMTPDGVALFSAGALNTIAENPKDARFRYDRALLRDTLQRYFKTVQLFEDGGDVFAYDKELKSLLPADTKFPGLFACGLVYCSQPITNLTQEQYNERIRRAT